MLFRSYFNFTFGYFLFEWRMQFLSENRLKGCQIQDGSVFKQEPNMNRISVFRTSLAATTTTAPFSGLPGGGLPVLLFYMSSCPTRCPVRCQDATRPHGQHAYYDMVEVVTGRQIPIWRTVVFSNRKQLYLSCRLRYVDEMWFVDRFCTSEEWSVTTLNTKPEVVGLLATAAAILKLHTTSLLCRGWPDWGEIW